ncbi:DEAD/DEAH box helicase [Candidatus Woesearchaeota archaeon]|nr:DEAD/DEAH box helicase [Candidatus Woesearchaeota archaeon]
MQFHSFTLDRFQEEAIHAVERGDSVLVSAPTGSGKTLIADYIIDKYLQEGKRVIYTAPIKALSNQKFRDFREQYGDAAIGLITGDIVENPKAQVIIMTTEVYRNMAIIKDKVLDDVAYCIMDEIHYISDFERGHIWEESIIFSHDRIRFLFLSATIPNAEEFAAWVQKTKGHTVSIVHHTHRPVPLVRRFYDAELGITTLQAIAERKKLDGYPDHRSLRGRHGRHRRQRIPAPDTMTLIRDLSRRGKLPCIYFVFSRQKTQAFAEELKRKDDFLGREEKARMASLVARKFDGVSPEVAGLPSARLLRECLAKGIAFHHAGLLPDIKHIVETLFAEGLVKVLFATETFAVGINYPAKTVCIDSMRKYTGQGFRFMTSKEYFQISGRAGRRGMDKEGLSVAVINRRVADVPKVEQITKQDVDPLLSQFRMSTNTILNLVHLHTDEEIAQILKMNFHTFQQTKGTLDGRVVRGIRNRFDKAVQNLTRMGYITPDRRLTWLGAFTTRIFSDEIEISQLFAADFPFEWDELSVLVVIGALVYEEKREIEFRRKRIAACVPQLVGLLRKHPHLRKGEWWHNLETASALVFPVHKRLKFIQILDGTSMPEGDLIRFYMQLLDRLEQVDRATQDEAQRDLMRRCKRLVRESLEGIHIF